MTRWPPTELFGLHVDLGDFHSKRRVWLRLPVATFTCICGYEQTAVGSAGVADLTERTVQAHAQECRARTQGNAHDRTDPDSESDSHAA